MSTYIIYNKAFSEFLHYTALVLIACLPVACNIFILFYFFLSQLEGDQQKGKEAISDYWSAISNEKQNEEGSLHSVEAVVCAETNKTASGRTMQLEKSSSIKCRDSISCHHHTLEETQQSMSHNHNTTRNKPKDFRYDEVTCSILKFFFLLI